MHTVLLEYALALAPVAIVVLGATVRVAVCERALSPRTTSDDVIFEVRRDSKEDEALRYIMAGIAHKFVYVASIS